MFGSCHLCVCVCVFVFVCVRVCAFSWRGANCSQRSAHFGNQMGNAVIAGGVGRVPLPEIDSAEDSDSPREWYSADARDATSATLELTWRDQGWGNRKGTLHARKAGEEDWVEITSEPAPHESARLVVCLPTRLLGGGEVQLGYTIGGGGGHRLIVTDASLLVRGGEPSVEGASSPKLGASDATFTIDPGDKTCEALLDSPYGDAGQYRSVFEEYLHASRRLVIVLIEEFSRLLHFSDLRSIRKAAAIKYLCRDFVAAETMVDLAELRDQQTYLDETVLLQQCACLARKSTAGMPTTTRLASWTSASSTKSSPSPLWRAMR